MNRYPSGVPDPAARPSSEAAASVTRPSDLGPASNPAPSRRRTRHFRVDVGTIVSVVALTQSLLLVALGYWGSQRLVSRIGISAHKSNHDRTEDKVNAFLAKAESVVGAIAGTPSLRPAGDRSEWTAEMLWTMLQQSPELDSLYVANDEGRMLMALRYPAPAVRYIEAGQQGTTETWQYKRPLAAEADFQQRYETIRLEAFQSGYDPKYGDPFGRTLYTRVNYKF